MSYKNGGCRTAGQDFQGDLDIGGAFSDLLPVTQAVWVTLRPERKGAFTTDTSRRRRNFNWKTETRELWTRLSTEEMNSTFQAVM